jgi:hypothetical protein
MRASRGLGLARLRLALGVSADPAGPLDASGLAVCLRAASGIAG